MYDLPYFKESDETIIHNFIYQHPFAFLIGCDHSGKPVTTQVPVFIEYEDDRKFLRGHIMKQTDHHKAFLSNPNVLVVFNSPHAYVSATWYSDPHQASTWNYMSVHVSGIIRFLDDKSLIEVLRKTTLHFENDDPNSSTVFDNLSETYTTRLMAAIVAFEVEITEIKNVFKLSQNRDAKSFENIIHKLKEQGAGGIFIAGEMEKIAHQLFPSNDISNLE